METTTNCISDYCYLYKHLILTVYCCIYSSSLSFLLRFRSCVMPFILALFSYFLPVSFLHVITLLLKSFIPIFRKTCLVDQKLYSKVRVVNVIMRDRPGFSKSLDSLTQQYTDSQYCWVQALAISVSVSTPRLYVRVSSVESYLCSEKLNSSSVISG